MLRLPPSQISFEKQDCHIRLANPRSSLPRTASSVSRYNRDMLYISPVPSVRPPNISSSSSNMVKHNGDASLIYSEPSELRSPEFWKDFVEKASQPRQFSDCIRETLPNNDSSPPASTPPTHDSKTEQFPDKQNDDLEIQKQGLEKIVEKEARKRHFNFHPASSIAASVRSRFRLRKDHQRDSQAIDRVSKEQEEQNYRFDFSGFTIGTSSSSIKRVKNDTPRLAKLTTDTKSRARASSISSDAEPIARWRRTNLVHRPKSTVPRRSSLLRYSQLAEPDSQDESVKTEIDDVVTDDPPISSATSSTSPRSKQNDTTESEKDSVSFNDEDSLSFVFDIFEDPMDILDKAFEAKVAIASEHLTISGDKSHWFQVLQRRHEMLLRARNEQEYKVIRRLQCQELVVAILHDHIRKMVSKYEYDRNTFPNGLTLWQRLPNYDTLPSTSQLDEQDNLLRSYRSQVKRLEMLLEGRFKSVRRWQSKHPDILLFNVPGALPPRMLGNLLASSDGDQEDLSSDISTTVSKATTVDGQSIKQTPPNHLQASGSSQRIEQSQSFPGSDYSAGVRLSRTDSNDDPFTNGSPRPRNAVRHAGVTNSPVSDEVPVPASPLQSPLNPSASPFIPLELSYTRWTPSGDREGNGVNFRIFEDPEGRNVRTPMQTFIPLPRVTQQFRSLRVHSEITTSVSQHHTPEPRGQTPNQHYAFTAPALGRRFGIRRSLFRASIPMFRPPVPIRRMRVDGNEDIENSQEHANSQFARMSNAGTLDRTPSPE